MSIHERVPFSWGASSIIARGSGHEPKESTNTPRRFGLWARAAPDVLLDQAEARRLAHLCRPPPTILELLHFEIKMQGYKGSTMEPQTLPTNIARGKVWPALGLFETRSNIASKITIAAALSAPPDMPTSISLSQSRESL